LKEGEPRGAKEIIPVTNLILDVYVLEVKTIEKLKIKTFKFVKH